MAAPTIVNQAFGRYIGNGYGNGIAGLVIPSTTPGNGLVVMIMGVTSTTPGTCADTMTTDASPGSFDNSLHTYPIIDNFTRINDSTTGYNCEIWYVPACVGGSIHLNWEKVSPEASYWVNYYELSGGIGVDAAAQVSWEGISPNAYSSNHTDIPGPALVTSQETLVIAFGLGCPSFGLGNGQAITNCPPFIQDTGVAAHLTDIAGTYQTHWARQFNGDNWAITSAAFFATATPQGTLVIRKVTDPSGSPQSFDFTSDYGSPFSLTDGGSNVTVLSPGTYSVSEDAVAGWTTTTSQDPSAIVLADGETITVTFTNTQKGHIVVSKVTSPTGSVQSFDFTSDYGSPFSLSDGDSNDSGELDPGTYSVSETPIAGWTTQYSQTPSAIVLGAGQTITLVVTNSQSGNIVIQKVTDPPGSAQSFTFTPSYGSPFSLTDGQSNDSGQIAPGTYSVSEAAVDGWTTATSQDPAAIVVVADATTTVTFTNTLTPTPPPTPVDRVECTFVSTSPAEIQPSDDRPTLPAPAGPQTWVYDFGTRGWFQLQRGFTSLAVFEIGEGELILVGGAEDGFVYVIDDLNGTFDFSGTCPVASFRPALIDFGDPSSMRVFKYLELEFTSDALAEDITVTYWLDPPNVDNPGEGKTMTLTKVRGADRWRGWPTGGALCQRLLIDITARASTNTGAIRGAKIVADKIKGLTT